VTCSSTSSSRLDDRDVGFVLLDLCQCFLSSRRETDDLEPSLDEEAADALAEQK
jgi:hypothetical protein